MDFFTRVREVTKLRGTTIEQMLIEIYKGEKISSPRDVYNGWRRRKILPRADIAVKIAQFLNVSVEYLVTGEDTNPEVDFYSKYSGYKNMMDDYLNLSPANKKLIEGSIKAMAEKK